MYKNLLTKVTILENCKFAQTNVVNPVAFASPSIRSKDIKLQEVQRNMPKIEWMFHKTTLKTNEDDKRETKEAIQTILNGIKMSGHTTQNLLSIRKNFILTDVSTDN